MEGRLRLLIVAFWQIRKLRDYEKESGVGHWRGMSS
jgi:hypothetical protein